MVNADRVPPVLLVAPDSYLRLDLTSGVLADRTRPGLAVHTATLDRPRAAWVTVRAALVRPDVTWAGIDEDDAALSAAVDRALATTHRTAVR